MFSEYRKDAVCLLQGRFLRSLLYMTAVPLSLLFFAASVWSCIWFLIVDTSFLAQIKVFGNLCLLAIVCALAVIVNVILFFLCTAVKLKCESYFANTNLKITLDMLIKYTTMSFIAAIKKIVAFVLFISPFLLFSFITDIIVKSGITSVAFILLISACVLFLISGILSYLLYIQKYSALTFMFIQFSEERINVIFRLSEQITDGKCSDLLRMKIWNIPKKLTIFMSIAKVMELNLITEKKPYATSESHTEKSVVFYFDSIKEC